MLVFRIGRIGRRIGASISSVWDELTLHASGRDDMRSLGPIGNQHASPSAPALVGLAFILAACASTQSPQSTASSSSSESTSDVASAGTPSGTEVPAAEAVAKAVDIGGRSLYLECRGSGEPTILFFHGDGGDRTHGYHLLDAYSDRHKVCVYDRANMGLSDTTDGTQTGADVIADLMGLLDAADVPGPYLVVANSFGGLLAELFAAERPDQLAGMVLVDASLHADADVDRYFAEQGELDLAAFEAEYARGPEKIVWTIHDEARASLERIPDVPIRYLRASESGGLPTEAQAIWDAGLEELLARSSDGQVIDVTGPHTLPPGPVHDAIDEMLDSGA